MKPKPLHSVPLTPTVTVSGRAVWITCIAIVVAVGVLLAYALHL
jgi:hypothetical protein